MSGIRNLTGICQDLRKKFIYRIKCEASECRHSPKRTEYLEQERAVLQENIPYEERDGIFYPVLVAGTEKADIDVGKYGRMWIKYIKEEYPMRYKSLVRFGELEERADEVNDTAYELLDDIEAKWLKKHKPKNPNSFTEQLQLRTQTRMMAEEIVIMDVVMQFH